MLNWTPAVPAAVDRPGSVFPAMPTVMEEPQIPQPAAAAPSEAAIPATSLAIESAPPTAAAAIGESQATETASQGESQSTETKPSVVSQLQQEYSIRPDGKWTYYRQFAGWLWSKGREEDAAQYLEDPSSIDWDAPRWVDTRNKWAIAGPTMFGRERISGVDLFKAQQISLYTLTRADATQTAQIGIIEEAETDETTIVETLGFRLLQKRIRRSEAERSSGATAETIEMPDLLRAAQGNAGFVSRGMAPLCGTKAGML